MKLIRCKELAAMLGVSKATVWRMVRDGRLPKPLKLGERITAWRLDEVEAAIERAQEVQQ